MANINYLRTVGWDVTLRNLGTSESGDIINGEKITAGAPAATAGYFLPGCIIQNIASGICYINEGTKAAPVWSAIEAGTIALASGQILVGSAGGIATARTMSGDVTLSNTGVATIAAGAVTSSKLAEDTVRTLTVVLSSSDILQLFTFPITLIAAPGAGKVVIVDQIIGLNNFATVQYAGGNAMEFRYNNTAGVQITQLGSAFINSAADRIDQAAVGGFTTLLASNQPVIVWVPVADPTAGDGAITLQIRYRIVTSPF